MLNHGLRRVARRGLAIPTSNLEFFWDGALSTTISGAGGVEDLSGNNRDGSYVNTPVFEPNTDNGTLRFDNADNDYVTLSGYNGVTGTSARSVAMFARTTNAAAISNRLISWGDSSATGSRVLTRVQVDGSFRYIGNNFVVYQNEPAGGWVGNDNNWHSFIFTMPSSATAGDITMYVDGVTNGESMANGNTTDNVNIASTQNVAIGIGLNDPNEQPWDGYMAMVAIYSRELSAQEVVDIHNYKAPDLGMSTI